MKTTDKSYIDKKQSELFEELGIFFAFNKQQFEEGIEKAGGVEKQGKYIDVGHGMCCPKKNLKFLLNGMENIKANWEVDREQVEQVQLIFVGIDSWNRPVWKAPDQRAYFGSVNELFDYESTEEEVLKKVDTYGLCYMGDHFGCEPMGTDVPDQYFI
ncbi:MAG: hypothetical protein DRI97_00010 [Bacteroidetes bacterium]|nr:MAG: hypothetical protein DRI97_00010 [Bacteroidota bacterium]